MTQNIRWLHLSDFHVGMDGYGQRNLFSKICDHVRNQIDNGFEPDFVFLTGDIANRGAKGEYIEFFDSFLEPLAKALGDCWRGNILAVPGNHDVERSRMPHFSADEILGFPGNIFDPTGLGLSAREQFVLRFENYTDSDATGTPSRWLNSEEGTFLFERQVRACKVGVIGINTAWLSKDNYDRHRLTPGIALLESALEKAKDCHLRIVLGHHPLDWLEDKQAGRMRALLGKHSALYLHGHFHEDMSRYEDGSQGQFLAVQCGSAFQGRSDDDPKWVNGLIWAECKLQEAVVELYPFHWSANDFEWKLVTTVFPNIYDVGGKTVFPLPSQRLTLNPLPRASARPKPSKELPDGFVLVDTQFLSERQGSVSEERYLQFFNGSPPTWRIALSDAIPQRKIVADLRSRFFHLEKAERPTVVNILGPGSEGKSTAFLQTIATLVREDGWTALWRYNDFEKLDIEVIKQLSGKYPKLLIAIDEAYSVASSLPTILSRLGRLTPHFLLCSRTLDWRAEVRDMRSILTSSDYQEVTCRGLTDTDATMIVNSWGRLGKAGLGRLTESDLKLAATRLYEASRELETDEDEGALFGAILSLRDGDKLKDRIRSVLYQLAAMQDAGPQVLDAYAIIAAMHSEGLRFLSLPVLAEYFGVSVSDCRKNLVRPLADEAIAAGGGRFLLCRHKTIAKATVSILREANLFGDIDAMYGELCRAAIVAKQKETFVPELSKWRYAVPEHFIKTGDVIKAVETSEAMLDADKNDIYMRVKLSKIYRDAAEPYKAAELFRKYDGEMTDGAWNEWAVAERLCDQVFAAVILAAISLGGGERGFVVSNDQAEKSLTTIAISFYELWQRYQDRIYLSAIVASGRLALKFATTDSGRPIQDAINVALSNGGQELSLEECVAELSKQIRILFRHVDFDSLARGRVAADDVANLKGLNSILARKVASRIVK